jgi:hypothetical protein
MSDLRQEVNKVIDTLMEQGKKASDEIKVTVIVERINATGANCGEAFRNDFLIVGKINNGVYVRNATSQELIATMMSVAHVAQPRMK